MEEKKDWRYELLREGVELHELLESGMPNDDVSEWLQLLEVHLGRLSTALVNFGEECEQGLYDDCLQMAPQLRSMVTKLSVERNRLQTAVRQQIDAVSAAQRGAHESTDLRESVTQLVHLLDQHNHHAVDLVYSAYDNDLGGPG